METPQTHDTLLALNRFFVLSYRQEARRLHPDFHRMLPLAQGARVDMVRVNGGRRTHLFYRATSGRQDIVFVHDVQFEGRDRLPGQERQLIEHQLGIQAFVAHVRLSQPYDQQFDEVGATAHALVRSHSDAADRPRTFTRPPED